MPNTTTRAPAGPRRWLRAALLALAALAPACEEPGGLSDELRWYVWPGMEEPTAAELDTVAEIFGLELTRAPASLGAVTIYVRGADEGNLSASAGASCTSHVWTLRGSPTTLAHELGHSYGLAHDDSADNLMGPAGGTGLRDDQLHVVRRTAFNIADECR